MLYSSRNGLRLIKDSSRHSKSPAQVLIRFDSIQIFTFLPLQFKYLYTDYMAVSHVNYAISLRGMECLFFGSGELEILKIVSLKSYVLLYFHRG